MKLWHFSAKRKSSPKKPREKVKLHELPERVREAARVKSKRGWSSTRTLLPPRRVSRQQIASTIIFFFPRPHLATTSRLSSFYAWEEMLVAVCRRASIIVL
jgi:hypothetical protein